MTIINLNVNLRLFLIVLTCLNLLSLSFILKLEKPDEASEQNNEMNNLQKLLLFVCVTNIESRLTY